MCYHIISPKNLKMLFSGKDELMGNLRAAALACGVVASVLGGGIGVAYITSSTVKSADMLTKEEAVLPITESAATSTSATKAEEIIATTYNRTTTKRSYTAELTTAAGKNYVADQEGTTSQRTTEAATTAHISRSVPAPAHAPAALTQPVTQEATTAAIVAKTVESAAKTTPLVTRPVTTTTTTVTTTTAVATTTETIVETEYFETATEAPEPTTTYVEPEEETIAYDVVVEEESSLPITDEEYIILCNAVAHEAGCNWISEYDKALVVEVIMNRVNSPHFPNTIYDVLTQRNQFTGASGYVNLGTYSNEVTQSVKNAVTYYFENLESFTQGYLGFRGDGYRNIFS